MMRRRITPCLVVLVSACVLAFSVQARTLTQITFDDWLIVCDQPDEDAEEQCVLTHSVVAQPGNLQLFGVSITYDKESDTFPTQFAVPLGTSLLQGMTLEVQERGRIVFAYSRCDATACYVEQVLAREVAESFNDGFTVRFADRLGKPLSVTVSESGVDRALDELHSRATTWVDTVIYVWDAVSTFVSNATVDAPELEVPTTEGADVTAPDETAHEDAEVDTVSEVHP